MTATHIEKMRGSGVSVHEVARGTDLGVAKGASLRTVLQLMQKNDKGAAVLLDDGRAVGILTERDVVGLLHRGVDLDEDARTHARPQVVEVNGTRHIGYALNLMVENNIRRLVVVNGDGVFLGMVTQQDLLRHLEEDFYQTALRVKHVRDQLRELIEVGEEAPVNQVLGYMVGNRISAVPVVRDGLAIGIITEKDVLRLANEGASLDGPVRDHMSSPVVAVDWDARLVDTVRLMNQKGIRRVVIAGGDGRAEGMLTNRDLIRNLEGDYNDFLERKLKYTKEVLNLLPEMLLEVLDTGSEQLVVWANDKVFKTFDRSILDKPVTEIVPVETWGEIHSGLVAEQKVEDVRFKQGGKVFELSGFHLPMDRESEKGRHQLVLRDITEEFHRASTDELTEVYNRRYMNEFLAMEAERSRRMGRVFSVAIVDVDDFKRVNDTHGHSVGDLVLKEVVKVLISGTREYDVVGRYGGEEFLAIMPEVTMEVATAVMERIRTRLEQHVVEPAPGRPIRVTVSCGVAAYGTDGEVPEDILIRADERLYQAKRSGKNRVVAG